MRGADVYSERPLRGVGPTGMCHEPSMKMFFDDPSSLLLFWLLLSLTLWASMACWMVTRLLVGVDEDMVSVVEDEERREKCGGDGEQLVEWRQERMMALELERKALVLIPPRRRAQRANEVSCLGVPIAIG